MYSIQLCNNSLQQNLHEANEKCSASYAFLPVHDPHTTKSAFFSNQSFANVVCRLLNAVCRLLNAAKIETNTSFNQSLLTLFDLIICIHMLVVNIGDRLV